MGLHFQLEYANLCLAENSRSADPAAKNMNRGRRPAIRHKDMRRMSLQARALRGTHAAAGPENASGLQATKGRAGTRRSVRLPGALGFAMGYGRQTRAESRPAPCGGKNLNREAAAGHPAQGHAQAVPAGARIARDARGGRAR